MNVVDEGRVHSENFLSWAVRSTLTIRTWSEMM